MTVVAAISEFLKVVRHAQTLGKVPMPHSPYFGPGYWATLHLCGHLPEPSLFEFMYVKTAAWVDPDIPLPRGGNAPVRLTQLPAKAVYATLVPSVSQVSRIEASITDAARTVSDVENLLAGGPDDRQGIEFEEYLYEPPYGGREFGRIRRVSD